MIIGKDYSGKGFYWGLKPHKLVPYSIKYLAPKSTVLDLGSGEGRHAIFLAKRKFKVTAVDISKTGILKTKQLAKKQGLKIKSIVSDVPHFLSNSKKFEAIYCMNVLQFLGKNAIKTIKKIKSKTNSRGINVIVSFIADTAANKKMAISRGRYAFSKRELLRAYTDWKIIFYEEKMSAWETHGEKPHRHFVVELIAQKL